jgi:hypothetical protein
MQAGWSRNPRVSSGHALNALVKDVEAGRRPVSTCITNM